MQRLEVSGAVRPIYGSLGVKRLTNLMHKFLFYNKFIICLYVFRASGIITPVGGRPVNRLIEDTRCCIIQFCPRDDEHIVLETCRSI